MQMFYYSDKGVLVINVKLFISSSCINYLLQGEWCALNLIFTLLLLQEIIKK